MCFSRRIYESVFKDAAGTLQTNGEFRHAVDIYQTLGHYISSDVFVITFQIAASKRTKHLVFELKFFLLAVVVTNTMIYFFCFVLFVFRLLNSCLVFFFLLRAGEYHACF